MSELQPADMFPYAAGAGVLALAIWLFMRSRGRELKKIVIPQYMHTRTGGAHELEGEAITGVMLTESHGGQRQDPAAVVTHRWGRLWADPGDRDPGSMRKRRACYVTREGDSSVLNLRSLWDDTVPLRDPMTRDDLKPVKNLAGRNAMANAVMKPSSADDMVRRLFALGFISVFFGGASWLAITIFASLRT